MIDVIRVIDLAERGVVEVVADAEALAVAAAERVVAAASDALDERGSAAIALSGGSTPKRLGELLATADYRDRIDWDHVVWFWGDERWVPLDADESNAGGAMRSFLKRVPAKPTNIQPWKTTGDPHAAASSYATTMRRLIGNGEPPVFDLILLGMGDDGHTASLFPGTAAVHERAEITVAHRVEKLDATRLTFTPPLINAAREVAFLVGGAAKAERLKEVLRGPIDLDRLPSQAIRPVTGDLIWHVDEPAASLL